MMVEMLGFGYFLSVVTCNKDGYYADCRHVTFLCGRGGVYALGALVANYMGNNRKRDLFLGLFNEVR